ncbi:HNH endonuclease [Nocardioides sp. GY 10127]|uniref:HNH endonuclease n=1 Tax=Nocardioides sp. GY 10127 TaxID=2569762 RepID=UPI00197D885F|nr:HNH endonuclease [Nocardioides sp. GY 10127]
MARRSITYAGRSWQDPRNTRAWRALVALVVREEPVCWLRYPGVCTVASTTADHVIPWSRRPDLGMDRGNLHGACRPCNEHRGNGSPSRPRGRQKRRQRPAALSFFD